MKSIQQSELYFYLPITLSYAVACIASLFLWRKLDVKSNSKAYKPNKPWLELLFALLAVFLILVIGQVYSAGYLIPKTVGQLSWVLNNLIIFSPIFIVIILRKQPADTLLITKDDLLKKLGIGLIAAFFSVTVFIISRSEYDRVSEIALRSIDLENLSNFVAVFLEGVAIAFLFIRLKWVSNLAVALIIPALLFAFAHVPGMLAENDPWWHISLMSLVTGSITIFVLYSCYKTRDIIWLGVVHYFLDVAIRAF